MTDTVISRELRSRLRFKQISNTFLVCFMNFDSFGKIFFTLKINKDVKIFENQWSPSSNNIFKSAFWINLRKTAPNISVIILYQLINEQKLTQVPLCDGHKFEQFLTVTFWNVETFCDGKLLYYENGHDVTVTNVTSCDHFWLC
jgi:hypothetical protein